IQWICCWRFQYSNAQGYSNGLYCLRASRRGIGYAPCELIADADDAVAGDGVGLAGADAEHDDAEEIAEIVPAAVVGHGVDRDLVGKQRDHPGDREDEAVPQAEEE